MIFDDGHTQKQYLSTRLWNMYRGTKVSTELLESIHMALEEWLYQLGKSDQFRVLELFCEYLLKKSKSASTSAVVNSIVLAFPNKLFKIAKILISVREFFRYDLERCVEGNPTHMLHWMNFLPQHRLYFDERNIANQYPHRKLKLETIALYYQAKALYDNEPISDIEQRRLELSTIFDHHKQIIQTLDQNDKSIKEFGFCLAMMDYRNQKISDIKCTNGNTYQVFEAVLPPDMEKQANEARQNLKDMSKYINLLLWAEARFKQDITKYKDTKFESFENNPVEVYQQTKQIMDDMVANPEYHNSQLLSSKLTALTSAVLIRDFYNALNDEIRKFCKEIILTYASLPIKQKFYNYSISDGVEQAISILPILVKHFPAEEQEITSRILLLLLTPYIHIKNFITQSISDQLWALNKESANFIFNKFLYLEPIFSTHLIEYHHTQFQACQAPAYNQLMKDFYLQNQNEFNKQESNYPKLDDIELSFLNNAFLMLPAQIIIPVHIQFLTAFLPKISSSIFNSKDKSLSDAAQSSFLKKISDVLFYLKEDCIKTVLEQLMLNLNDSQNSCAFLKNILYAANKANKPDIFWNIWNQLYPKIIDISRDSSYFNRHITCEYLLAGTVWIHGVTEWHSLEKDNIIKLFEDAMRDIGGYTEVFYSIAKFISGIGQCYIEDGIRWITTLLKNNTYVDYSLFSGREYKELV